MTRKMRQLVSAALAAVLCLGLARAVDEDEGEPAQTGVAQSGVEAAEQLPDEVKGQDDPYLDLNLRIGLAYGSGALTAANLLNASTSPVTGYRFGYFDGALDFVPLANTAETALTMLKTTNIYRVGETYYESKPGGTSDVLGCYHLQVPATFDTFEEAQEIAGMIDRGFVAWVDGIYYVRQKSFTSFADAAAAVFTDGLGERAVVYTSVYSVNVVKTGTTDLLFQFDGLASKALGIMPGQEEDAADGVTWFKGYKYYGGFRYERIGGGNLTVVGIVPLDTYVKGVVPYESYKQWPLETLKAQAMCAKNYGLTNRNKHNGSNFDLCATTDCQVYHGAGSGSISPSELSDQAVDEIRGSYVWYGTKLAQTYFYSSNGGGSEDVSNVWGSNQATYPYLAGVIDPYEAEVASQIPNYTFSKTFTKAQLTSILQEKGYASGTKVSDLTATYSKTGNVLTLKFTYENGKSNTFNCPKTNWLKNALGCRSIHFTVTPTGGAMSGTAGYAVNGDEQTTISRFTGLYAISGSGTSAALTNDTPYVVTNSGAVSRLGVTTTSTGEVSFLISGAGWGHNIGYSQWGGYAMALRGFTYEQILEFYFTGVHVGSKAK